MTARRERVSTYYATEAKAVAHAETLMARGDSVQVICADGRWEVAVIREATNGGGSAPSQAPRDVDSVTASGPTDAAPKLVCVRCGTPPPTREDSAGNHVVNGCCAKCGGGTFGALRFVSDEDRANGGAR